MDFLKEKSKFNIDSAQCLIENNLYAPSVHCSYYGSFQFMKHKLKNCRNATYGDIEVACLNYKGGTHGYIIDNILQELKATINNNREFAEIKRIIKDLKAFRIKSDYYDSQILNEEAQKSIDYSKEIIQTIKTNIR